LRLCRKELRETLRDRRTILTLVLMPLLLYPLLSMTLQRFLFSARISNDPAYRIAVIGDLEANLLRAIIDDPKSQPPPELIAANDSQLAQFEIVAFEDLTPEQAIGERVVDLAVYVQPGQPPALELWANSSEPASLAARRILVERLQWLRSATARARLAELAPGELDRVPKVHLQTVGGESTGSMLATLVPLVLVLMTITGAVYPAIDLTAGERERGTIEALIASPVPRGQVLFAKYTAVVTVALLTAVVNLVAMFITLKAGGMLRLLTGSDDSIPWFSLLQIFGLLVLFSGFFSAVLLCLTSFARSFKEAQAYLIPLMLLSLAPGVLSLIPGVTLTPTLALVPLVNIILLARELIAGTVDPVSAAAAVLSTITYAAAALGIAARLFGTDAILRGSEISAASMFRRPSGASDVPSVSAAALAIAVIFPVYFWVSNTLAQATDTDMAGRLVASAASLVAVFGGIPLAAALLGRDRLMTTFRLLNPIGAGRLLLAISGAALMGMGLWALAHESFVLTSGRLDEQRIEMARKTIALLQEVPLGVILLSLAIAPGVIEELCFRGYLFSAFQKVMSPPQTIVLTALLFGLFHVLTGSTLLIERFVPTTMMGLFLGWVAYRTGSVWAGMVLHSIHNGFLNIVGRFKDKLAFLGTVEDELGHLPATWLIVTTLIAVVGLMIVWFATRPTTSSAETTSPSVY